MSIRRTTLNCPGIIIVVIAYGSPALKRVVLEVVGLVEENRGSGGFAVTQVVAVVVAVPVEGGFVGSDIADDKIVRNHAGGFGLEANSIAPEVAVVVASGFHAHIVGGGGREAVFNGVGGVSARGYLGVGAVTKVLIGAVLQHPSGLFAHGMTLPGECSTLVGHIAGRKVLRPPAGGSHRKNDIINIGTVGGSGRVGGLDHDGDVTVGCIAGDIENVFLIGGGYGGGIVGRACNLGEGGGIRRVAHGTNLEGAGSVISSGLQGNLLAGEVCHLG